MKLRKHFLFTTLRSIEVGIAELMQELQLLREIVLIVVGAC